MLEYGQFCPVAKTAEILGEMRDEELDVELLMTDIQRRIDPAKLPSGQTVIKFKFTDLKNYANWWIKIVDRNVDLCVDNPGYDVDVFLTADLRTMTEVWMGDVSLQKAQDDRRLMVNVLSPHLRNLKSWFPLYRLADIRPARTTPVRGDRTR